MVEQCAERVVVAGPTSALFNGPLVVILEGVIGGYSKLNGVVFRLKGPFF